MKPVIFFLIAMALSGGGIVFTDAVEPRDCHCEDYPFEPDPPCSDVCYAKSMAIATEQDLIDIFGLSSSDAKTISKLPPKNRPRSIECYRLFLGDTKFTELKNRLTSLRLEDFKKIRRNAEALGNSISSLEW